MLRSILKQRRDESFGYEEPMPPSFSGTIHGEIIAYFLSARAVPLGTTTMLD